jgi:hypothetical protein
MTQIRPSKEFIAYVQARVLDDVQRSFKEPKDVFAGEFWSAAAFDWYMQTGEFFDPIDSGGLAKIEANAYKSLIDVAQKIRASDATSNASWEDYFKRYPIDPN